MTENFIIGIGGTGARVLESFVHCCAAGFGPKGKVHLMLVDPDDANGNLNRTQGLIEKYRTVRESLHLQLESTNAAFRTELVAPVGKLVWNVIDKASQSLNDYIGYGNLREQEPSLAGLAELLFTQQERETKLNEGFRGHPAIGAVVMAQPPLSDPQSPLGLLAATMAPNKTARVFLVGSIFGGTGAAGFPTLGKVLKQEMGSKWGQLELGGALVLPYFSFVEDPAARGSQMFVTPHDFPAATKAALHYYDENELPFDQYYFVGDSLSQDVGKFSPGTATQQNRPHYVELVSALAAFDFFAQPDAAKGAEKKYFIASRKNATVGWDDLPVTRDRSQLDSRRREFREDISQFTLFCYSYLQMGLGFLAEVRRRNGRLDDNWFRRTFDKFETASARTNPAHSDNLELLEKKVADYARVFLAWITSLAEKDEHVQLINRDMLVETVPAGPNGPARLQLKEVRENLGQLVSGYSVRKGRDEFVFTSLNGQAAHDEESKRTLDAGHRFVNLFFRAAPDFLGLEKATVPQR